MAIIARASNSSGETFVPAPVGMHRAICVDCVDLGMVTGLYGTKHLVRVIWQTEALMPDGRPYMVDRRYTLSLDERSNLRKDLETWRGKPFTLNEAAGFDLERLIGVQCSLVVVQKAGRDGTKMFSNIKAVFPAQPGAPLAIRDYVRVAKRGTAAVQQVPAPQAIGPSYVPQPAAPYVPPDPFGGDIPPLNDSDIPF